MLLLRNGEQLLLTMFIPITLLVGLILLPLGDLGEPRAATVVPAILALAVISTAFTGQAIAVGFDRRYGALKRLGATALPQWAIIAGKSIAVVLVVALQAVLIGGIGATLGWRPSFGGLLLAAPVMLLGAAAFAALGLLLGGWLKAEVVLALANILWFFLLGFGSLALASTVAGEEAPGWVSVAAHISPSGALVSALHGAFAGAVPLVAVAVLTLWGAVGAVAATRTFRFT
jgi:ABC-2 type transport system permease protein